MEGNRWRQARAGVGGPGVGDSRCGRLLNIEFRSMASTSKALNVRAHHCTVPVTNRGAKRIALVGLPRRTIVENVGERVHNAVCEKPHHIQTEGLIHDHGRVVHAIAEPVALEAVAVVPDEEDVLAQGKERDSEVYSHEHLPRLVVRWGLVRVELMTPG